ncbi:hypothetical protein [Streptomyces sp. NPDC049906]|uniref:hypothetical protein n=1 Tax=Streptomyces sp. NPDC049906 TaxID=3155656 RepID=UPI003420D5C6
MPDEQERWPDREVTERLLRGERPEDTGGLHDGDGWRNGRADRLAGFLDALRDEAGCGPDRSARPREHRHPGGAPARNAAGFDGELPGEAAAVAAYRVAHARRTATAPVVEPDASVRPAPARPAAGRRGHVRRRPRWARPVRFTITSVLVAGMIGGVAVATGTGVLPTPFDGRGTITGDHPHPRTTAPVPVPPTATISGGESPDGASGSAVPEHPFRSPGTPRVGDVPTTTEDPTPHPEGGAWVVRAVEDCREHRQGALDVEGLRRLERAAGGPHRVAGFCVRMLARHAAVPSGPPAAGRRQADDREDRRGREEREAEDARRPADRRSGADRDDRGPGGRDRGEREAGGGARGEGRKGGDRPDGGKGRGDERGNGVAGGTPAKPRRGGDPDPGGPRGASPAPTRVAGGVPAPARPPVSSPSSSPSSSGTPSPLAARPGASFADGAAAAG